MKLTEAEMIKIHEERRIDECTADEKAQIFRFFFGDEYMTSDDKGAVKEYAE